MVPEDLAVDADHPQVQFPQRPAEKRLEALGRQRHKPPATRRCSTSPARSPRPAPGPVCPHTGVSTPRRRPRPAYARPAGRWPPPIWKLASGTSPSALRTRCRGSSTCRPPSVTWLSTLPPRQTGRDAQAMECFPDTVDHAEDRQRHLDRDGSRVGGLAGRLPPVMLRHGWQSPFLIASPVLPQDRGRSRHPLHLSSSSTASGTSPAAATTPAPPTTPIGTGYNRVPTRSTKQRKGKHDSGMENAQDTTCAARAGEGPRARPTPELAGDFAGLLRPAARGPGVPPA